MVNCSQRKNPEDGNCDYVSESMIERGYPTVKSVFNAYRVRLNGIKRDCMSAVKR